MILVSGSIWGVKSVWDGGGEGRGSLLLCHCRGQRE